MKRYRFFLFIVLAVVALASCTSHPDVPSSCKDTNALPPIFPDYCDVTVPCNIAPLNFMLSKDEYEECVARFTLPDGKQETYGSGVKVQIPEDEWHEMLDAAKGKSIKVEVWGKVLNDLKDLKDPNDPKELNALKGEWLAFKAFEIIVAEDPIDEYVSYRVIEPTYVAWSYMEIAQRNVTNFEETQIFNNEITSNDKRIGQCINCHSYQNYKTDNMLFHVRLSNGCTVIVNDGKVSTTNLKRDYTISSGVYPAWHPTEKLIAFSTNLTRQAFHTSNSNKIEVYDLASDMILYDIEKDSVSVVSADSTLLEVYPTWSPDGKYLYYCKSAPLPEEMAGQDIRTTYEKVQYSLYRRSFDIPTRSFGDEELIYDAAALDKSVTLPRISPDGRHILFAQGRYGCFHIRHADGDIKCFELKSLIENSRKLSKNFENVENIETLENLENLESLDLSLFNSEGFADSYPSWSSNGRWIMCSSRRGDGIYSRLYFSYFKDGKATKAFLLPQRDPEHNTYRLKCYNRPEFMVEPVKISVEEFSRAFPK